MSGDRESESISDQRMADLPLFGVEGLDSGRLVIRRGGGAIQSARMSAGVGHMEPDGRTIDVVSHPSDRGRFEKLRAWAAINILLGVAHSVFDISTEQRHEFEQAAEQLRLGQDSGIVSWETMIIAVDGEEVPFEVCQIIDNYWCAIGQRPDVYLTLHSRGVPLADLSLAMVDLRDDDHNQRD